MLLSQSELEELTTKVHPSPTSSWFGSPVARALAPFWAEDDGPSYARFLLTGVVHGTGQPVEVRVPCGQRSGSWEPKSEVLAGEREVM